MGISMKAEREAYSNIGRVLNRELFLYFLDSEVKRARRYQNYLSLLILKLSQCRDGGDGKGLRVCYQALTDLITGEVRETDMIGSLEEDKLVVLFPYADEAAGKMAKSRFEKDLTYCDFKTTGYDVSILQVNYPVDGTSADEMIQTALGTEAS
jgi:GGDEF domain-containing protein